MARILIAEDEDSVRGFVSRALQLDGHDVVAVPDGADAFDTLMAGEHFDLLLSDIRMPIMDGIALALMVGRDFPDLTILMMTGFADQRERAADLNALIFDVVTKPFSLADIRNAVGKAIASRAQAA